MDIHIIAFIGIIGLNVIVLGLVIYWYRNKMLSHYNSFLNKADEILGGKQIDMRYDESFSKPLTISISIPFAVSKAIGICIFCFNSRQNSSPLPSGRLMSNISKSKE